jgi:hypothetical protein
MQENFEEGNRGDNNEEEMVPSLNQLSNRDFDRIILLPV